ncbi:aromatic-ring-hydroxylating dioxygenase subunit beta [Kineosporia sp. NBRC 101731]|uniref:aromatic-ring-hydroxylating dioxygenase subunit beta n=1 Tax=Kineosporia sp. NBRC 101731 TaxID=3032199 RepID=UPI0024A5347B|nr:aromatic-ring-hydroxylating dioxygenase subunit beta [Kineosporia sp. NBRC 101731]GLY31634.1 hypothetical protein Kisp02_49990 [Kineosporia sp. NBRC 101731]
MSAVLDTVKRSDVEDWLYAEADILDAWDYDAWLALFEPGARFEVPTTDFRGWSPLGSGSFVTDDWDLIKARVKRLKSRKAHAENPHSRTHRLVSNVRLHAITDPAAPLRVGPVSTDVAVTARDFGDLSHCLRVTASFVVHRARDGRFDSYVGRYDHVLAPADDGFRFRLRRSILGHEVLTAGARLSFIL